MSLRSLCVRGLRPAATMAMCLSTLICSPGCSGDTTRWQDEPDASTDASPPAVPIEPASISLARQVGAKTDAAWLLAPGRGSWRVDGDRLLSKGWTVETSTLSHIGSRIPRRADGVFEVGLGPDPRYRLHLTQEGADKNVSAVENDGRVLYPGAYPSTDVVVVSENDRFEAFLMLRDSSAPTEFTWRVERAPELAKVTEEPTNSILFSTADGRDRMRIAAPFAVDANGERRVPKLTWDGERVRVSVDVTGLTYPILVDPLVEPPDWKQLAVSGPSSRRGHVMALDYFGGHKIVLYGGLRGSSLPLTYLGDTWEWDAGAWVPKAPNPAPSARAYAAMSAATDGVLLFGGISSTGAVSSESWIYSGGSWTKKTPSTPPPARYGAAMSFSTGGTVVFGGLPSGGTYPLSDTWVWLGGEWTHSTPSNPPQGRAWQAMAFQFDFNASTPYALMLGGDIVPTVVDHLYTFDGASWQSRILSGAPTLANLAMAYDETRKVAVAFGGSSTEDCASASQTTLEVTETKVTAKSPGIKPPARCYPAMAYDEQRKQILLFGGGISFGTNFGDTWAYQPLGVGCSGDGECTTGHCVDGVCCETACNAACQRCNDATNVGKCTPIKTQGAEDPGSCDGDHACRSDGLCRLKLGYTCAAMDDCVSKLCSDSVCCNTACDQACDACVASRGAPANGTCGPASRGDTGVPACVTYACDGTNTTCPNPSSATCQSDLDCAADSYCNVNGKCVARKAQAQPCNEATECVGGDCRICSGSLSCVDGYCCDSACAGECNSCAFTGHLGACTNANPGYPGDPACPGAACNGGSTCPGSACAKDTDCNAGYYCAANGTCQAQKNPGGTCNLVTDCLQSGCRECSLGFCVDGFCCNESCQEPCSSCSVSAGTCSAAPDGATPRTSICGAYLCSNASRSCPTSCNGDVDCTADSYCAATHQCVARKTQSTACGATTTNPCLDAGCRECETGKSCVDGYCCDSACNGDCNTCAGSTKGTCLPMSAGSTGAPTCAPYLCNGSSSACPNSCSLNTQCAAGNHCEGGLCVQNKPDGAACSAGTDCVHGFCVDGVCCNTACNGACDQCNLGGASGTCSASPKGTIAASCSYLCDGASASCPTTCASDGECAPGLYCNDSNHCVTKKSSGAACSLINGCVTGGCQMCGSGHCVDGVCCDTSCANACDACNLGGKEGTCSPVPAGNAGSPACQGANCNGTSPTCPGSACTTDANCSATFYCAAGGTCQPVKPVGASCDVAADCSTANCRVCGSQACVDGYCCNAPCGASCDRCNVTPGTCTPAPSGATPSPTCDNYLCNGSASSCPATCTSDFDCVAGAFCDASDHCTSRKDKGQTCGASAAIACQQPGCRECMAGLSCADGFCCDTPCSGRCDSCSLNPGTCTPVADGTPGDPGCNGYYCDGTGADCPSACATNFDCTSGFHCETGLCKANKPVGAACASASECVAGASCVDGFCCNSACNGPCEACNLDPGVCTSLPAGTQPNPPCGSFLCSGTSGSCPNGCTADSDCGADGYCNKSNQCVSRKGLGLACGTSGNDCLLAGCRECASGFCADGFCCDTACGGKCDSCSLVPGTCGVVGAGEPGDPSCGGYLCDGASADCPATCSANTQCADDFYCDAGACTPKKAAKQPCTTAQECKTGACADSLCCDRECSGQCEACDVVGKEGVCSLVSGPVHGTTRLHCAGEGADCGGTCNGVDLTCRYPDNTKKCGTTTCANDVLQPQVCDGQGACVDGDTTPCVPYGCDGASHACKSSCITTADCAAGAECNVHTGTCASSTSTCVDDFTAKSSDGTTTSCVPYRCLAGVCQDACTAANDCANGYECHAPLCVQVATDAGAGGTGGGTGAGGTANEGAAPAADSNSGGCGCRVDGSGAGRGPAALLVGLLASSLLVRRRRSGPTGRADRPARFSPP